MRVINGAANKPQQGKKLQVFPPEAIFILMIVQREAPNKQQMAICRLVVAGAMRPRQRPSSATTTPERSGGVVVGWNLMLDLMRPRRRPLAMCLMSCYIFYMVRGSSGHMIIEVDPSLKRALHARLISNGRSLKDWFLECAEPYLDPAQKSLPLDLEEPPIPDYAVQNKKGAPWK